MKIMIVLLLNIFICFNFTGCGIANAFGELNEEAQYIENKSDEILFCFDNNDAEKLKSMLSKNDQLKFDIDEQIHNAFNLYNGKSISYEHFDVGTAGGKDNGVWTNNYIFLQLKQRMQKCNV